MLMVRKSDPDLFHADYLDVLERVIASSKLLSEEDIETIGSVAANVHVSHDWVSDIFLPGRRRMVYIEPVAADNVLEYIIEVEDQLQAQELRRE